MVQTVDYDEVDYEARQQVEDEGQQCGPERHPVDARSDLAGRTVEPPGWRAHCDGPTIGSRSRAGSRSGRLNGRVCRASGRCGRRSCWTRRRFASSGHACSTIDRRGTTAGLLRTSSSMMANSRGVKSARSPATKALVRGGVNGQRTTSQQRAAVAARPAQECP